MQRHRTSRYPRPLERVPARYESFVDVELAIGPMGGVSAASLLPAFAWLAAPLRALLKVVVFLIDALIGMKIPLVMRALHARHAQFADLVRRVLTFDYWGALAVALLFPIAGGRSIRILRPP